MTVPLPVSPGSDSVREQIVEVLADWNALPPLACLPLAQREAVADALVPLVGRLLAEAKAEALADDALRKAIESLADELDERPHVVNPTVSRVGISRRLRCALTAASSPPPPDGEACRCAHPKSLHDGNEGRCIGWANDDCRCFAYRPASPSPNGDVRQHRMNPDCWCGPVNVGPDAWEHRNGEVEW